MSSISSIYSSFDLSASLFSTNSSENSDSSFSDILDLLTNGSSSNEDDWLDAIFGTSAGSSGTSNWMDALFSADTITTASGEFLSLDGVADMFNATFCDFTNMANQLFSLAGVSFTNVNLSASVTLQATGTGGLSVSGTDSDLTHDASNAVSHNTALTADFMISAAYASIAHAADTVDGFMADYNADPAATMEKYEATLKELLLSYQVSFSASGTSYGFADGSESTSTATDATDSSSVVA